VADTGTQPADLGPSDAPADGPVSTLTCGPARPFPSFGRACASSADCAAVVHQSDCCGTMVAIGIRASERAQFEASEQACRATYPLCMCAPRQLQADDGSLLRDDKEMAVACRAGVCTSYRVGCGAPCSAGMSCFGCPEGPQTAFRCSHVCANDGNCGDLPQTRCMSLAGGPFCAPQSCGTP